MGRWLEIITADGQVIDETVPYLLIKSVCYLPKDARTEFPILTELDLHSEKYIDEEQILKIDQSRQLFQELKRLRDFIEYKYFIKGVDQQQFYKRWRGYYTDEKFYTQLDDLNNKLQTAIDQNLRVRVML